MTSGPGFETRIRRWHLDHTHGRMPLQRAVECGRAAGPPGQRIAWLDTETTGLAGGTGTYVFLVGIAAVDDGGITLTQRFLYDLGAEPEMLTAIDAHLRRYDALVTFNGTRFDLPLLQTRFLLSRMRAPRQEAHLDLMTLARRLWYRRFAGYSLALLEQAVLQVDRVIDVPGWQIPSLYVQFLSTGDFDVIEPVFAHNAQDILSLVALHGLAGELLQRPQQPRVQADWFGLGRLLDARGDSAAAARCYRLALDEERHPPARRRAITALARHLRRTGDVQELLALWERERDLAILPGHQVLERLAMIYQWQLKDPARALALTEQALAALDGTDPAARFRLLHRRDRLARISSDPRPQSPPAGSPRSGLPAPR